MKPARELLAEIHRLAPAASVNLVTLSGDQERAILLGELRRLLPPSVRLLAGPGCPGTVCPAEDVYQAIRLVEGSGVALLAAPNLLDQPVTRPCGSAVTLRGVGRRGGDVRSTDSPFDAAAMANAEPDRAMVYFVAGFETLLAAVAGLVLEGMPDNLSVLLCGRQVNPVVRRMLDERSPAVDGLVLPGNRCAITGLSAWEALVAAHRVPAVVASYSVVGILAAVNALLAQIAGGEARLENCYRGVVHGDGDVMAQDRLFRVFASADGRWRGLGAVAGSGFSFRRAYDGVNADARYPDYRGELGERSANGQDLPVGCECASVITARRLPADCVQFAQRCTPQLPLGPCMASPDGACFLHGSLGG